MIVPTLRVGTHPVTLCVTVAQSRDAERPELHSHAERGNDLRSTPAPTTLVTITALFDSPKEPPCPGLNCLPPPWG